LRNYARLLNEPVEPVLEAYAMSRPEVDDSEQHSLDAHVSVEVRSSHGVIRLVTAVIVVILVLLPLIWWWEYLEQAAQNIVGVNEPAIEEELPGLEEEHTEAPVAEISAPAPVLMAEESQVSAPELEEGAGPVVDEVVQKPVPVATAPLEPEPVTPEVNIAPAPVEVANRVAPMPMTMPIRPQPLPQPTVEPAAVDDRIMFEFAGTSWVKVRDARGKVKLMGEFTRGKKQRLEGKPPFKVVLGNASAVRVKINGRQFDLERFSSGGVARFSIKNGKIGGP